MKRVQIMVGSKNGKRKGKESTILQNHDTKRSKKRAKRAKAGDRKHRNRETTSIKQTSSINSFDSPENNPFFMHDA